MSDSPPRLPTRPSLEQLRKQAKGLLRRARAGDEEAIARLAAGAGRPTLADAQRALARQYGFASWTRLREHVEALNPPGLSRYEQLAETLAAAYVVGDGEAVRELNWTYGTDFHRDRNSEAMRRRLPTWFASATRDPRLALADARLLVARSGGFSGWDALAASLRPAPAPRRSPANRADDVPPFVTLDPDDGRISVHGPLSPEDWDRVASLIEEQGVSTLRAGGMTDAGMARIARVGGITHLDVGDSKLLTDEGAAFLAHMPQLEVLEMGGWSSPLTDRALENLRHLRALRRFRTAWTAGFSDAGAASLAACEALEEAILLGTPTGDGALRSLVGKTRLRRVTTGRGVTDAGLAIFRHFPIFAAWRGGDPAYDLMGEEAEPNRLVVDGPFSDSGLAALGALDGLFALGFFGHSPGYTASGVERLRGLPHLAVFACDGKRCDDAMMAAIARLPGLRKLSAQGAVAGDAGFAALGRSATLEYLWGRECPNLAARGFAALAAMPALRGLAVSCGNLDDASLALLPDFPALRELAPIDVADAGFVHVGNCRRLEHLWCMYCRDTGDEATGHIAGLGLKSYYAGTTRITDRSLEILGRMRTLERVRLWHCDGVTDAGIAALARLPRLREVSLQGLPGVSSNVAALFRPGIRIRHEG
ncbi:MAG TPA: hypothetical protein VFW19_05315 [Allosphingosinicella sp.]|nr:hypothetical protein [Allosphingosinicella sp.]